ncbi:ABC transporter permease [Rhodoferax antarcticus]|uniref:Putative permease n=1 Tax=Rhodoferax antarcticus ANT.BR TaxID=1111071 RepID=A0A1Q8YH71_9BURK|nr:FtsX-like permease family protein [Rhodoferax antarcticus]APW45057.1 ABC transporter permease [Rhodoferax antarcticus]OLP07269.1 putative permease [Rhodoferax antarcticus ANT.BR]
MMTLALAVRNLLRNRRRSISTLLAIAIGSTSILLFGGYSTNINYSMQTAYVQTGGHLQIQHRDFYLYGSGNPAAYGIADYTKLLAAIENDAVLKTMVLVATPTLQFGGIAGNSTAGVSRTVIGNGFIAKDVNRMRLWNDFNMRSGYPVSALEGSAADAVIIGTGLARVLQLCDALKIARCPKPEKEQTTEGAALPDDVAQLVLLDTPTVANAQVVNPRKIDLLVGTARGAPNVASLEVIRAEDQGFKELDEVYMMMHLAQTQKLVYGNSPPEVTSIILQLRHTDEIPVAIERLAPILASFSVNQPLAVLDFRTLYPFYLQSMNLFDTIFGFIFTLIGAIVLFTVSNTMNAAVVERTTEIGTLRAIGLRRLGIQNLFVTEGALLGFAGALLGAVLALSLAALVNSMNLTWLPPGGVEPLPLTLIVWGQTGKILGTTFGLLCVAILSAWWPAYRASRLNVVDALRHV